LDITLDTNNHRLTINQSLAYHNNTGANLSEIYFNLIPNAFADNGGGIDVNSVAVEGSVATLKQVENTVYKIDLPSPVNSGATLNIKMEYVVRIPNIQNRFGYQDNVYNVGNFIITPAVYESTGWITEPYVDIGDAFYTDIANYTVSIHTPEGFTTAGTGTETSTGTFRAEKVRDFAFCVNDEFETITSNSGETNITVYFSDNMSKTAERVMETSEKSLRLFNELFGTYPYEDLKIILSGMTNGVSGMEYPTLIMVGPEITLEIADTMGDETEQNGYTVLIDRTVTHEIAHQWFYGIVGNDQIRYPWLDEGMCRFAEYLYEKEYSLEEPLPGFVMPRDTFLSRKHENLTDPESYDFADLNLSLYDWIKGEKSDYSETYEKSAAMIYQIEKQLGDEKFKIALKDYVNRFAFGFVTDESFKQFWNEQDDFSELFELYFKEIK
jgi:hypothetical protein